MKSERFEVNGRTMVIRLQEDLDHHNAVYIREMADNYLEKYPINRIIFDFSGVEFMDSSGLGLILGRFNKASEIGTEFTLLNPADSVRKILDVAGIARMIKIERKK